MEIRPIREYALPKFALLLAATTVAGTMTACGPIVNGGDVAVSAMYPDTVETDVELMGEEAVSEDPENTEVTEASTETTETATTCVELAGDVDVIETSSRREALVTPGTGPVADYEELEESNRQASLKAQEYEEQFTEGFRQAGVALEPEDSTAISVYYLTNRTDERDIILSFFSGDAELDGQTVRDFYRDQSDPDRERWFDWGRVTTITTQAGEYADAHTYIEIQVDMDNCGEMTAALADEIAQEALQ